MGQNMSCLLAGAGVGLSGLTLFGLSCLINTIYNSIQPLPPTKRQLKEENLDDHPLFRHLKMLRGKIAWRQIGQYPTPLHKVHAKTPNGAKVHFFVKREDLASPLYGGNKVRTLQHQLAACEAYKELEPSTDFKFCVVGSHGSNQVLATKLHGQNSFHLSQQSIQALYLVPDEPDLDNTLNVLSTLSIGGTTSVFIDRFRALLAIVSALFAGKRAKLFSPGGNNICGVLGQIGALLELAEQIEKGEMPDPTAIYLPYGSGCTTTGLTIGVALARHLGMDAFKSPDFKIVGVIVHHAFAAGQAKLGFLHWHSAPLSVAFGIDKVCSEAWRNLELFPFT